MGMYGGVSKAERNRIKIRVRAAMAAQTRTEGRYLGGRPPYGYRVADLGPHPKPSKAAEGRRLHGLETDPVTAPVVQRIFRDYLSGMGIYAIAEELTAEDIPSPSAYDRARNRHRSGDGWAKSAVRAILLNPRYTGHQVWSRQRKDEVLLDVEDVALGHTTKLSWNPAEQWIWSTRPAHDAIITREDWDTVQQIMAAGGRTRHGARIRTRHPYALKGRITCGACTRLMQGNWTNDQAYYRCRYPEQYALAKNITHPRNVLLREAVVLPELDTWLATAFAPQAVRQTIGALVAHQDNPARQAQAAALEAAIADADHRIRRYRAALDSGNTAAATIGNWIAEAEANRATAGRRLRAMYDGSRMTHSDVEELIAGLGDLTAALHSADADDKARVYTALGVTLNFDPERKEVQVRANPNLHSIGKNMSEAKHSPWADRCSSPRPNCPLRIEAFSSGGPNHPPESE